jgi:hypothetical protein
MEDRYSETSQNPLEEENENPKLKLDITKLGRSNFYFGRTLGEGSYARVIHAKMKNENSPEYAIKIMEKSHIQREKKVIYKISNSLFHSFINIIIIIIIYKL